MQTDLKPGYQTTEFWSMCGVQVTAFVVALAAPDATAKIMSGLTACGAILAYFYTRYQAKQQAAQSQPAPAPPKSPAVLPAILAAMLLLGLCGAANAGPRVRLDVRLYAPPVLIQVSPPAPRATRIQGLFPDGEKLQIINPDGTIGYELRVFGGVYQWLIPPRDGEIINGRSNLRVHFVRAGRVVDIVRFPQGERAVHDVE